MATNEKQTVIGWIDRRWRPGMAWSYMGIVLFDFIIAPVAWNIAQAWAEQPLTQWIPLSLQGGGLIHAAMGAIIGVTAWGRTREKLQFMLSANEESSETRINNFNVPSIKE